MTTIPSVTIHALGIASSPTRTKIQIRDLMTEIDGQEFRDRTNAGPSPTEMLSASLAGATTTIGHREAESIGLVISDVSVSINADISRRGVTLQEPVRKPFPEVRSTSRLIANGDDTLIHKFHCDLEKYCPVTNLLRQAPVLSLTGKSNPNTHMLRNGV